MNDRNAQNFQIPTHASQSSPEQSAPAPEQAVQQPQVWVETDNRPETAPESEQLVQEIAWLGEWVEQARQNKLSEVNSDMGFKAIWKTLGGNNTTPKTLASKEAALSRQLFAKDAAGGQHDLFLYGRTPEDSYEWVWHRYLPKQRGPSTTYYEVRPATERQPGHLVIKLPDQPYRLATTEEIQNFHAITSRYYELVKSRLYS